MVIATIAIASSLHGALAVWALGALLHVDDDQRLEIAVLSGIATPVLAAGVASRALRSSVPGAATIGWAAVGGALNLPLVVLLGTFVHAADLGGVSQVLLLPVILVVAGAFGSPISVGLGVAFGTAFVPLIAGTAVDAAAPDHRLVARTALRCGAWLSVAGTLAMIELVMLPLPPLRLIAVVLVGLGLAVVVVAGRLEARHRAWLVRVRRGVEPGWAIAPPGTVDHEAIEELVPVEWGEGADHVLVRTAEAGEGAYRSAALRVPWALIGGGARARG